MYLHATVKQTVWICILIPVKSKKLNLIEVKKSPHSAVNDIPKWHKINNILSYI